MRSASSSFERGAQIRTVEVLAGEAALAARHVVPDDEVGAAIVLCQQGVISTDHSYTVTTVSFGNMLVRTILRPAACR